MTAFAITIDGLEGDHRDRELTAGNLHPALTCGYLTLSMAWLKQSSSIEVVVLALVLIARSTNTMARCPSPRAPGS
jgi:hypothetical protein